MLYHSNAFKLKATTSAKEVVNRIGDKWSLLVLLVLEEGGIMRFNELGSTIGIISQKMLTVTLRTLEADDLIKRKVYAQIPPKVEYELTSRGKSLLPHLHKLVSWADENMNGIKESRTKFEKIAS